MRTRVAAAGVLLAGTVLGLTACTVGPHSAPDHTRQATTAPATVPPAAAAPKSKLSVDPATAACWWAIRDQYVPGTAQLTGSPTPPPQCASLDPDDIGDVTRDVLKYQTGG